MTTALQWFACLLAAAGDPVSKCYEVCPSDSSLLQLSSYQLTASISPGAALAQQCPGGMLKADWQLSSCQPQPLQGRPGASSTTAAAGGSSSSSTYMLTAPPAATPARRELYLPQPAVAAESPVLLLAHKQQQGYSSSALGGLLPAARSSAPIAAGRFDSFAAHQHAAAAAARRSLPLQPGYMELLPPGNGGTAAAAATAAGRSHAAGTVVQQGSSSTGHLFAAGKNEADGVWPEPHGSMPARPYGSPQPRQWQMPQQQQQQQGDRGAGEISQQGMVQLGQQLLQSASVTGEATLAMMPSSAAMQQQAAAADDDAGIGGNSTSMSQCQQQQQRGWAGAGSSSRPGTGMSWSERQQHQLRSSLEAAATSLSAARAGLDASIEAASRSGSPSKAAAAGGSAAQSSPADFQQQQQQWAELRPGTTGDTDCAPRLGSPVRPYRQQAVLASGTEAIATAEAISTAEATAGAARAAECVLDGTGRDSSRGSSWQVHEVTPVSPSTQAGVALSNLSLLQRLSTGQLQAALEEAASPNRAQQQQQQQPVQDWQQQSQQEERWQQQQQAQQGWQQTEQQQQNGDMQEAAAASAGYGINPWLGAAAATTSQRFADKPQTPDTPHSAVAAAEFPAAPLRSSMEASSSAAAALQAATAAVHRIPPSPYGRSLGAQRYAADAAALCNSNNSQEFGVLVAGTWGGSAGQNAAAAGDRSPSSRWYTGSGSPSSSWPAHRGIDKMQQQLDGSLGVSAAATASTAAALDAAGEMLQPFNAPSAALAHQQVLPQEQQQQGTLPLGPALDPVAQALQGEVQQLRQEVSICYTTGQKCTLLSESVLRPGSHVVWGALLCAAPACMLLSSSNRVAMRKQGICKNDFRFDVVNERARWGS
jgi:hypothetical protein